jgi:hypothetical protein
MMVMTRERLQIEFSRGAKRVLEDSKNLQEIQRCSLAERVGFVRLRQGFGGISSCQRRHPAEALNSNASEGGWRRGWDSVQMRREPQPTGRRPAPTNERERRLAERVGFEPTCRLPDKTLSRRPRYDHFGTSPGRVCGPPEGGLYVRQVVLSAPLEARQQVIITVAPNGLPVGRP